MTKQYENLDALHMAYEALVKSGQRSLEAAYAFGQIVDALSTIYSYDQMADEIGRAKATVQIYARLYRRYPHQKALIAMAEHIGSYDVSRLAGHSSAVIWSYYWQCNTCGSTDTSQHRREKEGTQERRAEREALFRQFAS